MNRFRDIEKLSAYLDGQLSQSDSAHLESRIESDRELASALNDLRFTRGILRKLPARKAPRNFMLTRKMVGLKPPLPRTYSFFRFSSAFATLLLVLTFAFNAVVPRIAFGSMAAAPLVGSGGGFTACGGGGPAAHDPNLMQESYAAATEAPAADIQPMAPMPTEMPLPEDSTRKEPEANPAPQEQPQAQSEPLGIPFEWQITLLVIGLISMVAMFLIGQSARRKWN